ncbi:hypothetical protein PTTG_25493 [Puccinia triticina 1-1 BBBD Race 1]|uniref:Uncharacterized protein n=1 Tax=Puccinia triticina (isolate 1-1 / race 1 (BBBD)) TaxID=630390 RepID=A0A180H322_PUCT1|nr:hypothetical protein PTTG_25493 [Puccinia triticina 1-1 BBBD Race 1]
MEEVREARPGPLTGTQGHVSFSDAFDGDIDSVSESTCKIELVPKNADTRGDNRKKHARKQTMIDCRSILTPPDVNEQPQQAKRSASQVQSSSQPKWNSGGSGQPGKFAFPSKEFKS